MNQTIHFAVVFLLLRTVVERATYTYTCIRSEYIKHKTVRVLA